MLKWLLEFLPCIHKYEKVHTGPLGAYQTKHYLRCTKCKTTASCDCEVCRTPWRDW